MQNPLPPSPLKVADSPSASSRTHHFRWATALRSALLSKTSSSERRWCNGKPQAKKDPNRTIRLGKTSYLGKSQIWRAQAIRIPGFRPEQPYQIATCYLSSFQTVPSTNFTLGPSVEGWSSWLVSPSGDSIRFFGQPRKQSTTPVGSMTEQSSSMKAEGGNSTEALEPTFVSLPPTWIILHNRGQWTIRVASWQSPASSQTPVPVDFWDLLGMEHRFLLSQMRSDRLRGDTYRVLNLLQ
jgi:hypothetical protein